MHIKAIPRTIRPQILPAGSDCEEDRICILMFLAPLLRALVLYDEMKQREELARLFKKIRQNGGLGDQTQRGRLKKEKENITLLGGPTSPPPHQTQAS